MHCLASLVITPLSPVQRARNESIFLMRAAPTLYDPTVYSRSFFHLLLFFLLLAPPALSARPDAFFSQQRASRNMRTRKPQKLQVCLEIAAVSIVNKAKLKVMKGGSSVRFVALIFVCLRGSSFKLHLRSLLAGRDLNLLYNVYTLKF